MKDKRMKYEADMKHEADKVGAHLFMLFMVFTCYILPITLFIGACWVIVHFLIKFW